MIEVVHYKSLQQYEGILSKMQWYTQERFSKHLSNQIWTLEHEPVYTLGQNANVSHVLNIDKATKLVRTDRGGEVTFHGPGQLMVYTLIDLKNLGITLKQLIDFLEQSVITTLKLHGVESHTLRGARGVYINGAKVCSIGLRVRKTYTYHGMCININNDISPFNAINPCGMIGMQMTSFQQHIQNIDFEKVKNEICNNLTTSLIHRREVSYEH